MGMRSAVKPSSSNHADTQVLPSRSEVGARSPTQRPDNTNFAPKCGTEDSHFSKKVRIWIGDFADQLQLITERHFG